MTLEAMRRFFSSPENKGNVPKEIKDKNDDVDIDGGYASGEAKELYDYGRFEKQRDAENKAAKKEFKKLGIVVGDKVSGTYNDGTPVDGVVSLIWNGSESGSLATVCEDKADGAPLVVITPELIKNGRFKKI